MKLREGHSGPRDPDRPRREPRVDEIGQQIPIVRLRQQLGNELAADQAERLWRAFRHLRAGHWWSRTWLPSYEQTITRRSADRRGMFERSARRREPCSIRRGAEPASQDRNQAAHLSPDHFRKCERLDIPWWFLSDVK